MPRERLHIAGAGPYCAASCWCHKAGECLCDPPCANEGGVKTDA